MERSLLPTYLYCTRLTLRRSYPGHLSDSSCRSYTQEKEKGTIIENNYFPLSPASSQNSCPGLRSCSEGCGSERKRPFVAERRRLSMLRDSGIRMLLASGLPSPRSTERGPGCTSPHLTLRPRARASCWRNIFGRSVFLGRNVRCATKLSAGGGD
jgi:hypothetical protein